MSFYIYIKYLPLSNRYFSLCDFCKVFAFVKMCEGGKGVENVKLFNQIAREEKRREVVKVGKNGCGNFY
jgi:hypothetical protein